MRHHWLDDLEDHRLYSVARVVCAVYAVVVALELLVLYVS